MNDRLGRFGPKELSAAMTLCTLMAGCFSVDPFADRSEGSMRLWSTVIALLLAWALLEGSIRWLVRVRAKSLGAFLASLPRSVSVPAVLLIVLGMLLLCVLLLTRFLAALCAFLYPDAPAATLMLYLLPCLAVLALLGMETLARTGRVLLPVTLLTAAIGLLSDLPYDRVYRLYPLLTGVRQLIGGSAVSLLRFVPGVLLLLCVMRGAQGTRHVLRAGRMGLLLGGGVTLLAEFCLCLSVLPMASDGPFAPLYRLLLEIDTANAAIRLDRVVLSVWTMALLYAISCPIYAAALLLSEAWEIRDIRPIALLLSAIAGTAALALYLLSVGGSGVLSLCVRYGWALPCMGLLLAGVAAQKRRRSLLCERV